MANRLAASPSLYLRKHAENPIDWWPWRETALQRANTENKPIFLSIGYSSGHWCTVMEGEAFSDPAVATYMNANFLPIIEPIRLLDPCGPCGLVHRPTSVEHRPAAAAELRRPAPGHGPVRRLRPVD